MTKVQLLDGMMRVGVHRYPLCYRLPIRRLKVKYDPLDLLFLAVRGAYGRLHSDNLALISRCVICQEGYASFYSAD